MMAHSDAGAAAGSAVAEASNDACADPILLEAMSRID